MRKTSRNTECNAIYRQLSCIRLRGHERQSAAHALRRAEAIVDAAIWVKERIAPLGGMLLKPVFRH